MQNKFGIKDFVLLALVLVIGISVWLKMFQDDRGFAATRAMQDQLRNQEAILSRIETALTSGIALRPAAGDGTGEVRPPVRDESWAREGAPVEWQDAWGFARDPRALPGLRMGGEFVWVVEGQPAKLTPVLGEDTYSRYIQDLVCERLAEFDPQTLKLRGVLAEAWQYDPAGHWLRVKIRENARFDDGMPITAEDVRYSLMDYIKNPELETEAMRSIVTTVEDCEVISEYVVEFKFSKPDAFNLAAALVSYVVPKHFYASLTPKQINSATGLLRGSGPFKMQKQDLNDQWVPPDPVVLVRNEQYWGPDKPVLGRIRVRTIAEDTARLISFTNEEVDYITPSSPAFVEKTQEPGWDEKAYSLNWVNMRSGYSFIGWQCGPRGGKLTPFHDKRVRQAMTLLIDRERMIRDIWAGIGKVATGVNNSASPASDPTVVAWPADPARAMALFAEAGWMDRNNDGLLEDEQGNPFRFGFTYAKGGQVIERIANYVKDQCASVGIQCELVGVDWSQYDQILKTRDFDAITLSWSASAPESDPRQIWSLESIQNQGHNFIQWDGGQQPLVEAICSELNETRRLEHWHAFHRLLHEEQPYTFVREVPWLRFISKDFVNVHTYPKGLEVREFMIGQTYNRGL